MNRFHSGLGLIALTAVVLMAPRTVDAREYTVAVVRAGIAPGDTIPGIIEQEVQPILPSGVTVRFDPDYRGDWTLQGAEDALDRALEAPGVDFVLTADPLVTAAATRRDLPRPVISAYVQRADWFGIADVRGDRSIKANLSFSMAPNLLEGTILAFRDLVPFDTTWVAVDAAYNQMPTINREIDELTEATGVVIEFLPVADDPHTAVSTLPATAGAVLLSSMPRLSGSGRRALIQDLTARRVATFSLEGYPDVFQGALATRTPDISRQLARRAALNLVELIRGVPATELPVVLPIDPKLLVNGRTALDIGYSPSPDVMAFEQVLYRDALSPPETVLTFRDALTKADQFNIQLSIAGQEVVTSRKDQALARSPLLPQIQFNPRVRYFDPLGLDGLIPEGVFALRFQGSQMIYDDRRISDLRSQTRLLEQTEFNRDVQRLDVLARAGAAYYRFALARLLFQVDRDNLSLTEENLDLAKFRLEVGYSGRDEVFRWEAERAKRQAEVFRARAQVETERVALNQILGMDQQIRWLPEESLVEPDSFPFLDGGLANIFDHIQALAEFEAFMVQFGIANAPELGVAGKGVEAQEIQFNQRKRRWWLPSFEARAAYDYQVWRTPEFPDLGRSVERVEVLMEYPLFNGTARINEIGREGSELIRLREEQRLTHDLLERRIRTVFNQLSSSFPGVRLGRIQAESAAKNLGVVQDQYAQGLVNVTDLLSAQNEAFVARQTEVANSYLFRLDLLSFQRAVAWFEDDKTPEDNQALLNQIQTALAAGTPASTSDAPAGGR